MPADFLDALAIAAAHYLPEHEFSAMPADLPQTKYTGNKPYTGKLPTGTVGRKVALPPPPPPLIHGTDAAGYRTSFAPTGNATKAAADPYTGTFGTKPPPPPEKNRLKEPSHSDFQVPFPADAHREHLSGLASIARTNPAALHRDDHAALLKHFGTQANRFSDRVKRGENVWQGEANHFRDASRSLSNHMTKQQFSRPSTPEEIEANEAEPTHIRRLKMPDHKDFHSGYSYGETFHGHLNDMADLAVADPSRIHPDDRPALHHYFGKNTHIKQMKQASKILREHAAPKAKKPEPQKPNYRVTFSREDEATEFARKAKPAAGQKSMFGDDDEPSTPTPAPATQAITTTKVGHGEWDEDLHPRGDHGKWALSESHEPKPNHIHADVRDSEGETMGYLSHPHDGTTGGIRAAHAEAKEGLTSAGHDWSSDHTRWGATDHTGEPQHHLSHDGHLSDVADPAQAKLLEQYPSLAEPHAAAPEPEQHWYGMRNRPPAIGAIPKGNYDHKPHDEFRHGQISYGRPLTDEEQYDYELTPIRHDSELPGLAKQVAEDMDGHVGEYLKPENESILSNRLKQEHTRKIIGHVDHDKLIAELRKQHGASAASPSVAAQEETDVNHGSPASSGMTFPTASESVMAGRSHAQHEGPISDAFRSGQIDEDHPAYKSISGEGASLKSYLDARRVAGEHVKTWNGDHGKVTGFNDDLTVANIQKPDGSTTQEHVSVLDSLGGHLRHDAERGRDIDKPAYRYLADEIAKQARASGTNIHAAVREFFGGEKPKGMSVSKLFTDAMDRNPAQAQVEDKPSDARAKAMANQQAKQAAEPLPADLAEKYPSLVEPEPSHKHIPLYQNPPKREGDLEVEPDSHVTRHIDRLNQAIADAKEGGGIDAPSIQSRHQVAKGLNADELTRLGQHLGIEDTSPRGVQQHISNKLEEAISQHGRNTYDAAPSNPGNRPGDSAGAERRVKAAAAKLVELDDKPFSPYWQDKRSEAKKELAAAKDEVNKSVNAARDSKPEGAKPFKPEAVPGQQMGMFGEETGGQKQLFNIVKPKRGDKPQAVAPSELEKIGDEIDARQAERKPLAGQKTIEDQYPSLKEPPAGDSAKRVSNDEFADGDWDQAHSGLASEIVQSKMVQGMKGIEGREYGMREHSPGKWQMVSRPGKKGDREKPSTLREADEAVVSSQMRSNLFDEMKDEKTQSDRKEKVQKWRGQYAESPRENIASGDIARHDWEKAIQNGVAPSRLSEMADDAVRSGAIDADVGRHLKAKFSIEDQYPSLKEGGQSVDHREAELLRQQIAKLEGHAEKLDEGAASLKAKEYKPNSGRITKLDQFGEESGTQSIGDVNERRRSRSIDLSSHQSQENRELVAKLKGKLAAAEKRIESDAPYQDDGKTEDELMGEWLKETYPELANKSPSAEPPASGRQNNSKIIRAEKKINDLRQEKARLAPGLKIPHKASESQLGMADIDAKIAKAQKSLDQVKKESGFKSAPDITDQYPSLKEPEATSSRPTTYRGGDLAEYTGGHHPEFKNMHEVEIMEGRKKGSMEYTARGPDGVDPYVERNQKAWKDQQEQFAKSHKQKSTSTVTGGFSHEAEADAVAKNRAAADARQAAKPAPLGMDGKTRAQRNGTERPPLPQVSIDMMDKAIAARDASKVMGMVDPTNKGWRAQFEASTGIKLPKTIRDTKTAVEAWAADQNASTSAQVPANLSSDAAAATEPARKQYDIYETHARNHPDGARTMHAVAMREDGKRGFGDTLHDTHEEAIAHIGHEKIAAKLKQEWQAQVAADEATKEKAKAEKNDLGGYGDNLKPNQKGLAVKALSEERMFNGKSMPRRKYIEEAVANGAVVKSYKVEDAAKEKLVRAEYQKLVNSAPIGNEKHPDTIRMRELKKQIEDGVTGEERRLEHPDGRYLPEKSLTKHGMDYASHLISKKGAADITQQYPSLAESEPELNGWKPENHVKIAADSIQKLRGQDVHRLLDSAPPEGMEAMAQYILKHRPELVGDIRDAKIDIQDERGTKQFSREEETCEGATCSPRDALIRCLHECLNHDGQAEVEHEDADGSIESMIPEDASQLDRHIAETIRSFAEVSPKLAKSLAAYQGGNS